MIKFFGLIIILFFFFSIQVHVTGHLSDGRNIYPSEFSHRQLILMTGNKIIAGTITDTNGYYELYFLDTLSKNALVDFYLIGNQGKDTFLLKSISHFENDAPVVDLTIFRKMKKKKRTK